MKKTVEVIILIGLVFVLGLIIGGRKSQEIIEKVRTVEIKGEIKYKTKEKEIIKPYTLVVSDLGGDWHLDTELSYLPPEMTVDSVKEKRSFDWLSPVRIGAEYNFSHGFKPVLGYAPIGIDITRVRAEVGLITNFRSLGLSCGLRYRNTTVFGSVYLDNSIGAGVSFRF